MALALSAFGGRDPGARTWRCLAVVAALSVLGCRRGTPAVEVGGDTLVQPLVVEWAGCAGIRKGPVCELGKERKLMLWVAGARDALGSIETDRGRVTPKVDADVDGGTRFTFDVPVGARTVAITNAGGRVQWSLTLGDAKVHDDIARLVAIGRGGKYEDALLGLEALRTRAGAGQQGPADAAIARMALALGKVDRAERAFRAAIAAAKSEGRIADVVRDGAGLLWALIQRQQKYTDARTLLEELVPFGTLYPEGRVWLDYHAGLLAADTADVRTALDKYRAAERAARRIDLTSLAADSTMEVARLLTRLGRSAEAIPMLRDLPLPNDSCMRATRILNRAWALMEEAARHPARQSADEIATALRDAETATQSCPDPHRRLVAVVNAAEYALAIKDRAAAERLVREIEGAPADRDVLLVCWRADVLGRWALWQGKPASALTAFSEQVAAARGAGLIEEAFRGEVGAGRALLALGRRGAAVVRLKAAQMLLEQMLRGIPLAEGRGSFLDGHDEGVRTLVGALVDGGAVGEAVRVARMARAAELAHAARLDRLAQLSPAARRQWDEALGRYQRLRGELEHAAENDWTLPRTEFTRRRGERETQAAEARRALDDAYRLLLDEGAGRSLEPSSPDAGEIYLVFFPAPDGWFAFAVGTKAVTVRRIPDTALTSPGEASSLLGLFDTQLGSARRVRLFPYGAADHMDWHAVAWRGRPLLASVEVEYALDVGTRTTRPSAKGAPRTALVVSNPTGDLVAATPEAELVARALAGWHVTRLDGPTATREATLAALPGANLFHYAGHAEVAGAQGLSSALLLKGNARVELGDLLAVVSVPDVVVLSACEAAGTAARQPSLMGLAQAFVAAGSQAGIAPTRPVGDEAARAFVAAFYGAYVGADPGSKLSPSPSVRSAFRRAVLDVSKAEEAVARKDKDKTGWQSFRLLVP